MPAVSVASTRYNYPDGRSPVVHTADVARTDTTAKELFTLNPGDIPMRIEVFSGTASNAGTNARLSIGSSGNATYFVAAMDLKGTTITSGGAGQSIPSSAANLGTALAFVTTVTATYAEAGTASTAGGPWQIYFWVLPG